MSAAGGFMHALMRGGRSLDPDVVALRRAAVPAYSVLWW
jgi:hypothetical protein